MTTHTNISDSHTAATIGVFDGLHLGHRHLVNTLTEHAHVRNLKPIVITFKQHPASVISGKNAPGKLISDNEKRQILHSWGVETVIFLDFDAQIAGLSSHQFIEYIRNNYGVKFLLVGFNNKFGSDRKSNISDYSLSGKMLGVEVIEASRFPIANVSSSIIRSLLLSGEVDKAAQLLGNFYTLHGTVVEGYHNGSKLGFPTANMCLSEQEMLLPANGVYAVQASVNGGSWMPAVCNIGYRPSVSPDGTVSTEVHILDYSGNIYNDPLSIRFVKKLRSESQFNSIQLLQQQLVRDCNNARIILNDNLNKYESN
ncbi:MAG: riboflavin biosynthesis protein RibF [Muribaculaceae bacterium]|nr:riboflavin biosynthesis protein RibF [Muribaculaceae bacterium]